ncbi:porin [Accumulibacter sp.]|uniref:porin n=1 Tax=Accumulibacter sp. TaxID=2053492 RepID=UPI002622DBC3|nr:porin [Accumulibacter sp.]
MQKKLIALAVAGLASGTALAQTNVTMYGIADAGYVYSWGDDFVPGTNKFSGIASGLLSGSRIGFKGEEALGNGLKAIFTLEYGLTIDNNTGVGTGGLNARQQFVGLSGGFGTVALGRQYAPGYDASARNDAFAGALFAPQSFLTAQAGNTITPNSGARWDNAVTYTTPNWGGFTGKAIYSFGETGDGFGGFNDKLTSTTDNGRWGLGANFSTGAFNVDALYQVRQNVAGLDDIEEWFIGGSFDLKFLKLMASYQEQNDKNVTNLDNQVWSVGAVIPVGNGNIHLGYAQNRWDVNRFFDGNTDSAAIAYTHSLSKRTTLYAGYVWVDNDDQSFAPLNTNGSFSPVNGVGAVGQSNQTFLAGIRHAF